MVHGIFAKKNWLVWLGVTVLTNLLLAEQKDPPPRALINWLAASTSFKKAGAFIGEDNYSQAKTELSSVTTNLPTPYKDLASEFLSQFDSALNLSTNQEDRGRLRALAGLCTDLGAFDASLKLQTRTGADATQLGEDAMYAWRLFDSSNSKAALEEYKRRLSKEEVEYWQDYFRVQVRLLEQRSVSRTNAQSAIELTREHYLKGLEDHADYFGSLLALNQVLPFIRNVKEAIPVYQLMLKCLSDLGDESGRTAWEEKFMAEYPSDPEVSALVYLDRGQKAYARKDMNAAEAFFRKVCNDYAKSSVYGDALYGLAVVLQDEQKYPAAMAEFNRMLSSNLSEALRDPESSEDYPNFKHKAASHLSECYEATKDQKKALEYALMARDQYQFISYCKDCMFKTRQDAADRVTRLQEAVKKPAATP